jgi:hypothetical protein
MCNPHSIAINEETITGFFRVLIWSAMQRNNELTLLIPPDCCVFIVRFERRGINARFWNTGARICCAFGGLLRSNFATARHGRSFYV